MSQAALSLLISGGGVLLSVIMAVFVAGMRTGELRGDMKSLTKDVAEIKGMFVLKLRDDTDHGGSHGPY